MYIDGGDDDEDFDDEFEEFLVFSGFIDFIIRMVIEESAISLYGYVVGYEMWCKIFC